MLKTVYKLQKKYLFPDWPAPLSVQALTTLRYTKNAFSKGAFANFNLSEKSGEDQKIIAQNRQILQQDWQWQHEPLWLNQVHGANIVTAGNTQPADACWTDSPEQPCVVTTADCLPILLCNSQETKVAAIHAGWRGIVARIIQKTVAIFAKNTDLLAWLGPAIGPSAFVIGNNVKNILSSAVENSSPAFIPINSEKWLANIYLLAKYQLLSVNVGAIYGGNYCTFNESNKFYSYRRNKHTGRMATMIWLR